MWTPASTGAYRSAPAGAPLPHGWSTGTTSYGRTFYVNHSTQSTTWERPANPAASVAVRNSSIAGRWTGAGAPPPPPPGYPWSGSGRTQMPSAPTNSTTISAGGVRPRIVARTGFARPCSGPAGSQLPTGAGAYGPAPPAGARLFQGHPSAPARAPVVRTTQIRTTTTTWEGTALEGPARDSPAHPAHPQASASRRVAPGPANASAGYGGGRGGRAPLPQAWSTREVCPGATLYINHANGDWAFEDTGATLPAPVAARTLSRGGGGGGRRVEAPLPPGWSAEETYSGEPIYTNHSNGSMTRQRPAPTAPVAARNQRPAPPAPVAARTSHVASGGGGRVEAPLPPGWSTGTTSYGRRYYVNNSTQSTTWEPPHHHAASGAARNSSAPDGRSGAHAPLPSGSTARTPASGTTSYYANQNTGSIPRGRPADPSAPMIMRVLSLAVAGRGGGLVPAAPHPADMGRGGAARGLSSSELAMLPQQIGNGSGPVDQCCVCMEDMKSTETIVRLPGCLHTFHRDCIRGWLSRKACCPLDQSTVSV